MIERPSTPSHVTSISIRPPERPVASQVRTAQGRAGDDWKADHHGGERTRPHELAASASLAKIQKGRTTGSAPSSPPPGVARRGQPLEPRWLKVCIP